jgi:hypothetical protein
MTQIPALSAQYVDRAADRRTVERLLNGQGERVAIYGLPGMGKIVSSGLIPRGAPSSGRVP